MRTGSLVVFCAALACGVVPTLGRQSSTSAPAAPKKSATSSPKSSTTDSLQDAVDTYIRADYAAAFVQWRQLADHGNAFAQAFVSEMFREGRGTPVDEEAATRCLRMAARQGDIQKLQDLAVRLGLTVDEAAIGLGLDERAAQQLGKAIKTGANSPKAENDLKDAFARFSTAAEQNKPVAERVMAYFYLYRYGGPEAPDGSKAMKWMITAAEHGDAEAMANVGLAYKDGVYDIARDPTRALGWLRKAAASGQASAEIGLGDMYENGEGLPPDYMAAESWYLKAVSDPQYSQVATVALRSLRLNAGHAYANGLGFKKDFSLAESWLLKVANDPDPKTAAAASPSLAALYFDMGQAYSGGVGVPLNKAEGAKWYKKAAEYGNWLAAASVANMYADGDGVPVDNEEANRYRRKAVDLQRTEAESSPFGAYNLAVSLGDQDPDEAGKLWVRAAEGGEQMAWHGAGRAYEQGVGVPKDLIKAFLWYSLNAIYFASDEFAGQERDRLEKSLSAAQVTAGKELLRDWRADHKCSSPEPITNCVYHYGVVPK